MVTNIIEIEGTWDQIVAQVPRYRERRMRLTILPEEITKAPAEPSADEPKVFASAWEYLQSLPPRIVTSEDCERIEREIQEEKNSWGD